MIELIDGLPDGVVGLEAVGRVDSSDYETVAAPAIQRALERHPKIRLIHVLDDRFTGYTTGGARQDAMLGLAHPRSFDRVAVVTDSESIRRIVRLGGWSIPGEMKVFSNRERDRAQAWASEGLDPQ
jgi:hypothetical protein